MLLKVQQEPLERLLAANLQKVLHSQLTIASSEGGKEEGLVGSQLDLLSVNTSMQYMETLLENFPPGEGGLKLQLPLG